MISHSGWMQLQTLSGWLGRGAVLPSADSLASEQLSVPARHSSGGHQGAAVAIGGYRWLQVATGGYKGYQCSVPSGYDDPPPPPPGHAGVRLLGPGHRGSQPHLQVRGPLKWGQVRTFFILFFLDLLLVAKHKGLIF